MAEPCAMTIVALVAQHHLDVYRYAYRLSGNQEDAEDLTQQVFLVAQENLAQLRTPEAARSWLFTILKRCFFKSRQRFKPMLAGNMQLNLENIAEPVPAADQIDRERLQHALDELPPKHRLVLVMFYFEEASYREIAERLELPLGTVMSRLARAKARLRERLFDVEQAEAAGSAGKDRKTSPRRDRVAK
ncbi:MAG: sigma-70 family RNA polymerase sigma factor [Planctomycetia bacterium]|nr:sigma-70 family RNA polymerase sigma factor [Planctomycetia bacterium]